MHLENVVFDAIDPQRLGRFWEEALGTENLSDSPEGFETRLAVPGGQWLDLCFQPVPDVPVEPLRLHLDLAGGAAQEFMVRRMLELGARPADVGQREVPWIVLADVEGNPFCVLEDRAAYAGSGQLAALPLSSADPAGDQEFWAWLTGWLPVRGSVPYALRHPSGVGPTLELVLESEPKGVLKNRVHLDVRLEAGEDLDAVRREIEDRGGAELVTDRGELPWSCWQDPSGNEFCVLGIDRTDDAEIGAQ